MLLRRTSYDKARQCIKKQRHHFAEKVHIVKAMIFSFCHVRIWELDHKEDQTLKNWCFWIVVLEKTLESPLDSKEIKVVNPKENQPWICIGRTDAEAKAPILWLPDVKSLDSITDSMDMNLSKLRDSGGQNSLVYYSPWGHKESDTT